MTYLGHFSNGYVKLDDALSLPEGTRVIVEVLADASVDQERAGGAPQVSAEQGADQESLGEIPTIWATLRALAGTVEGLPPDMAKNHDHYLYGLPKRP